MKILFTVLALLLLADQSQAVPILETFEDETAGLTSFSQGGFNFTSSGDLLVEFSNAPPLGAGPSDFWLGSGFLDGASAGSFGSFSITAGSFLINSGVFLDWTG